MSLPPVLLVGHGTRDPRGLAEFEELARLVAAGLPRRVVEYAYLELAEPTIEQAIARLAQRGAWTDDSPQLPDLVVAPLLLFEAGHAKEDIPQAVRTALRPHGSAEVVQTAPLECDAGIVNLSALRGQQAIASCGACPAEETVLLLVGRGSREAEANSQFARFARLRQEAAPVWWTLPCYVALTRPSLEDGLEAARRLNPRRVVVQPHLLFHGRLNDQVAAAVAQMAATCPTIEWIVAPHLGVHPLLVSAMIERIDGACPSAG